MSLGYWFTLTPPLLSAAQNRWWGFVAVVCIIASVAVSLLIARRIAQSFLRLPWTRVARLLSLNGIVLLILLFFRNEGIPFLGSRFWLLLLAIGDIVWAIFIARHFFVRLPRQRRAWEEEQQKRKYLR